MTKIMSSPFAPWQRLDAIRMFVFPALNFAMRCRVLGKMEWAKPDAHLRPYLKRTVYLPQSASTDYLYGSRRASTCGIPIAAEPSDLCRIDNAFKLLTSRNSGAAQLARRELESTICRRLGREADRADLEAFLRCMTEGKFRGGSNPLQNVWTEARKASGRLSVAWELEGDHSGRGQPPLVRTLQSLEITARS